MTHSHQRHSPKKIFVDFSTHIPLDSTLIICRNFWLQLTKYSTIIKNIITECLEQTLLRIQQWLGKWVPCGKLWRGWFTIASKISFLASCIAIIPLERPPLVGKFCLSPEKKFYFHIPSFKFQLMRLNPIKKTSFSALAHGLLGIKCLRAGVRLLR